VGVVELGIALVVGTLLLLASVEAVSPARTYPPVRGWRWKCLAFVPMIVTIAVAVPSGVDAILNGRALLGGKSLGVVGGAFVGIVASEFLVYWAHRLHHRVLWLWRWIHQLHHSAERVDVYGAAYFHPFEVLEGAVVGAMFFSGVLGLHPSAAAIGTLWQAFNGVFQHGNIRTPRWLGYFIQRPEQHALHHQRDVHGYNYANFPLWDIIFGTFRNPRAWSGHAGFFPGSSRPTWAMLTGVDISTRSGS